MSIHDKHKESKFETEIVEYLTSKDWIEGTSSGYDKKLALYTEDLISYIKNTQSDAYEKMAKREGVKTDEVLANYVAKELDKEGSLYFLRREIKYIGSKFKLCQFKPELDNPDLQKRYDANILRVVRQVYYSNEDKSSIDLVLFLNGIPLATLELKTDFTQNVHDAIKQYKTDRLPKGEPLLEFKNILNKLTFISLLPSAYQRKRYKRQPKPTVCSSLRQVPLYEQNICAHTLLHFHFQR
mgnify:CR=1 FL=1